MALCHLEPRFRPGLFWPRGLTGRAAGLKRSTLKALRLCDAR